MNSPILHPLVCTANWRSDSNASEVANSSTLAASIDDVGFYVLKRRTIEKLLIELVTRMLEKQAIVCETLIEKRISVP
jgi:hypothetical protein